MNPGPPACESGVYSHYDTGTALGQDIVDHQKSFQNIISVPTYLLLGKKYLLLCLLRRQRLHPWRRRLVRLLLHRHCGAEEGAVQEGPAAQEVQQEGVPGERFSHTKKTIFFYTGFYFSSGGASVSAGGSSASGPVGDERKNARHIV